MLRRLAAFCYRHRWRVLIAWVVLLVGVNVLAQTVGGDLLKTFSLPGSESQAAFDALGRDFARKGDTGDLVFKVRGDGTVTSPARRWPRSSRSWRRWRSSRTSCRSSSPYDPANARFVSTDGKIAYAEILFDVQSNDVPVDLATHMRGVVSKANTADRPDRARRLHVHRPDPARERGDRHPRRDPHPAARVRLAARDGPADHDRAVRHRHRARRRHAARPRAWTSRRSRRRSPR